MTLPDALDRLIVAAENCPPDHTFADKRSLIMPAVTVAALARVAKAAARWPTGEWDGVALNDALRALAAALGSEP